MTSPSKKKTYRAPALEKGLKILEILAKADTPLSTAQIAKINGRSVAEFYRMLQVLEAQGYILQSKSPEGYVLSRKMLALASENQPIHDLVEFALPRMRLLANNISQSCHLAVVSKERIVIILRAESSSATNFSVRVGYSQTIPASASGRLLFALQTEETKRKWLEILNSTNVLENEKAFIKLTEKIEKQGFEQSQSEFVDGVTDIAAPITDGIQALAALSIPFIHRKHTRSDLSTAISALRETADDISEKISSGIVNSL